MVLSKTTQYRGYLGKIPRNPKFRDCHLILGIYGNWLLNLTIFKLERATPNMSQHGGQTIATCCAQQCCDMLRWHVAPVWPGL